MRPTLSRRRMSYAVVSAGLVAGALVPLTASAATAACPTYTDDEGDAAFFDPATAPLTGDPALDILGITHSTSKGVLSSTVQLGALHDYGSEYSFGDWFEMSFTVAEKLVSMRVVRDANIEDTTETRLQVAGVTTEVVPEAVYDFDAATVTLTVQLAELEKAVGGKLTGKAFTKMNARSLGNYSVFGLRWDSAAAPEGATYVVGTACAGGTKAAAPKTAPATSGSGSPSASASPSASPAASASASPEPSESPGASASPSPTGPPPEPQPEVPVPADGCIGFADAEKDSNAAAGPISRGNDPDVDIVSVTGRTTDAVLAGHIGVAKLGTKPSFPAFTGHRFEYEFVAGGKTVVLRANTTGEGTGLVDGRANPDLVVTAVFDQPSSQVVLSVDRASLAKVLDAELPNGGVLSGVAARSYARTPATASVADTATPEDAGKAVYVVGDNECFRPKMSIAAPARVQTSDVAVVSVALVTSDGRVAKKQQVTARVGTGRAVSATTDDAGTATLLVPVVDAAGDTSLAVRSFGDAGEGQLRTDLRVLVERSLLTLKRSGTGSTRTVTATLTDDDAPKRALSGQRVTFTFGGRSIVATTDRAGRATARVPARSVVDVSFAGRTGFLSAAKARTTA